MAQGFFQCLIQVRMLTGEMGMLHGLGYSAVRREVGLEEGL